MKTYDHATEGAHGREGEHGVTNDEWIWPRFDDFASPLCRSATGGSNRSDPIGAEQGYTPAQADLTGSAPGRIADPRPLPRAMSLLYIGTLVVRGWEGDCHGTQSCEDLQKLLAVETADTSPRPRVDAVSRGRHSAKPDES